jgi:hypothetical protein
MSRRSIATCPKSPSKGGPAIGELRSEAKSLGINTYGLTRDEICQKIAEHEEDKGAHKGNNETVLEKLEELKELYAWERSKRFPYAFAQVTIDKIKELNREGKYINSVRDIAKIPHLGAHMKAKIREVLEEGDIAEMKELEAIKKKKMKAGRLEPYDFTRLTQEYEEREGVSPRRSTSPRRGTSPRKSKSQKKSASPRRASAPSPRRASSHGKSPRVSAKRASVKKASPKKASPRTVSPKKPPKKVAMTKKHPKRGTKIAKLAEPFSP